MQNAPIFCLPICFLSLKKLLQLPFQKQTFAHQCNKETTFARIPDTIQERNQVLKITYEAATELSIDFKNPEPQSLQQSHFCLSYAS